MEKVLCYPLGPVPWSLATSDKSPAKTDKSKLLHILEDDSNLAERPSQKSMSYIIDGNAFLQAQVSVPNTFEDLAQSVFVQLPNVQRVDFVTDTYLPMSIKETERARRGTSKTFFIKEPLTKIPRDWKSFLSNPDNKQQLAKLLFAEWQKDKYSTKLVGRKLVFACEKQCMCITSSDGQVTGEEVEELCSTQEEANTRKILHCLHMASDLPEESTIVVRSPDTDVFILLLKFAQAIKQCVLFDTGVGNKRHLIDVHQVIEGVGEALCSALPALHAYSGCDTTSAFVRKGKLLPLKTLQHHSEFIDSFLALGQLSEVEDVVFDQLEHFTCVMYNGSTCDINKLRFDQFTQKFSAKSGSLLSSYSRVDLSLLPSCRSSLKMHIMRANYQALIWCTSDQTDPDIPSPDGHGWYVDDGKKTIGGDVTM